MERLLRCGGIELAPAPRLVAARMWLDGRPRGDIAWSGRALPPGRQRGRVLCSAEARWSFVAGGLPLALPWRQPFALGRLAVSLSPAGSGLGASVLRVLGEGSTVAVATAARPTPLPGSDPLDLDPCDVIVVDARFASADAVAEADVLLALQRLRQRAAGGPSLVVAADVATALALAGLAAEAMPVALSDGLRAAYGRAQAVRTQGWSLTPAARAGRRHADATTFCSQRAATRWPASVPRLVLDETCAPRQGDDGGEWMPYGPAARGPELLALVRASGAQTVVAWGDGAGALAARCAGLGIRFVALQRSGQLSLL